MSDVTKEQVIEYLSNLPVIQIAELVKELEGKWGVSAAPVVQQGIPSILATNEVETKDEFDVILISAGDNKIATIKAIRELLSLPLKESKDLVESAPKTIREAVGKEEAEEAKRKLEEAGAKVEIK